MCKNNYEEKMKKYTIVRYIKEIVAYTDNEEMARAIAEKYAYNDYYFNNDKVDKIKSWYEIQSEGGNNGKICNSTIH